MLESPQHPDNFRKAFDSVPHNVLLFKLQSFGITGDLWLWLKSYLQHRKQCVRVKGHISKLLPVISGVPQGSILGPLLFILYINDLPDVLKSALAFIFADDTKCLKSIHNPDDVYLLQEDINALLQWSIQSNLIFSSPKCAILHFWGNPSEYCDYYLDNIKIDGKDTIKDLGILITTDLTWTTHHNQIVSKAYRVLGLIRRSFSTNIIEIKKQLYLSLVRSHLVYCSVLWRPYQIKDILLLERVQRRATKYILNDYKSNYRSRLEKLSLLPLMYMFELYDIMFAVKSFKNPAPHFDIYQWITFRNQGTRSCAAYKLTHTRSRLNSLRHFYFNRLPRLWNSLPPIDISLSIRSIRRLVVTHLEHIFSSKFDSTNPCTFHSLCPCNRCSQTPHPPRLS